MILKIFSKNRCFTFVVSSLVKNYSITSTRIIRSCKHKTCLQKALKTPNVKHHTETEPAVDSVTFYSPYYVENGLRKVYPYYYDHSTYCKGRWINQNLIDTYCKEFSLYPREEYVKRVLNGSLKINGKTVGLNYKLKNADYITSTIHRHELAVLATPINTIYEDENLLVVDKPPSMPVHSCSLYNYNTVSSILSLEHNYKNLREIHRLDRLTSGVLMYAKSSEVSKELHDLLILRNVKKEYICRVEGNFPEETIVCNKPIKQIYNKIGVSLVHPLGKQCVTEFQKLSFNGKSSVLLCKPHTGRTHQIRVHLQFLGFPIVNDPLYNSYVFGPEKGKNGLITKSIDQLLADLMVEHSTLRWLETAPPKNITASDIENDLMDSIKKTYYQTFDKSFAFDFYRKDPSRFISDESCHFCGQKYRDPKQTHLLMLLHALKYESDNWQFKTKLPIWASDNWGDL